MEHYHRPRWIVHSRGQNVTVVLWLGDERTLLSAASLGIGSPLPGELFSALAAQVWTILVNILVEGFVRRIRIFQNPNDHP